jgi:hypothetical protein
MERPMAESAQPREVSITLRPSEPPLPPIAANAVLVHHTGLTYILDFGFADPLVIAATPPGEVILAAHVGRIVMAQDIALKLRDQLISILGAPS